MMNETSDDPRDRLSLLEIDATRSEEEKSRSGKSGDITYRLDYDSGNGGKTVEGKVIEIGELADSKHLDLQPLSDEGYTHYGIFRLKDRTTTTVVQDGGGQTYKVFSFSRNNVNVSYAVDISLSSQTND
jgi:hypothetical protein